MSTSDYPIMAAIGGGLQRAAHYAWTDQGLRWAVGLFLVLRVITAITAVHSVYSYPLPTDPVQQFVEPWNRYDTSWYTRIAAQGYLPGRSEIAFPPLFPILIRFVAPLVGNYYALASLLISNLSCIVALWLLHKLVTREFGSEMLASRTLICLVAFPTGYYLVAGYTESPFLALVLGAWLMALDRRWWLAGTLACLAGLMRFQGAVLCLPLAWIVYVQQREPGWRPVLRRLPAVIGGAVGSLSWVAYVAVNRLGTLEHAQFQEWALQTRWPWESVLSFFTRWMGGRIASFERDNALALAFVVILAVVMTFQFRPPYALYVWGNLWVILMRFRPEPYSQFESIVRYALMMFPCFILLGMALRKWWLLAYYVGIAGYCQLVYVSRFVNSIWVA